MKTPGLIAIVGGGTAGWLSALLLQKSFHQNGGEDPPPKIAVIESPDIPTVGVGEGSTSIFRQVLLDLGIEESEFLKETGATLKFGIRHENWSGDGTSYFGPIDDPNLLVPAPSSAPSNWLHLFRIAAGRDIEQAHLFTWLMRANKSAYARKPSGKLIPTSAFHHAYHFDQAKLGRFLASKARGIDHILAEVEGAACNPESGNIEKLVLKDRDDLTVDFVIDCTGFRRAIISEFQPKWHSYASILPLNKAMPFWREHPREGTIAPFTQAKALSSGWMWSIPTQERVGCGYVFSDAHISAEAAQREAEQALGEAIEPRGLIAINPGRLETAWVNNCAAVGLAQSFLEPLEATSIHGTLVQLLMLTQNSAAHLVGGQFGRERDDYNRVVAGQVDDFANFINLHYAGGRQDSEFWRAMGSDCLSGVVRERLDLWSREPIGRAHFPSFPGNLPHVEEQLHTPVLSGLGLLPKGPSKAVMDASPAVRAQARKTVEALIAEFKKAARQAIDHREYLAIMNAS